MEVYAVCRRAGYGGVNSQLINASSSTTNNQMSQGQGQGGWKALFRTKTNDVLTFHSPRPDPPTHMHFPRAVKYSTWARKPTFHFACGQLVQVGPAVLEGTAP